MLALTRGAPLSLANLLSSIRPTDHVFTGVYESQDGSKNVIGQIHQSQNLSSAHLSYLLQPEENDAFDLVVLLEGLIKQAGHWGAKQVIADLAIDADFLPQFRKAGFSVWAKQRVFKCESGTLVESNLDKRWRTWTSGDIHAMRSLYLTLVPPLIQPVEPLTRREKLGLVYYDDNGVLQAYADLVYGPAGAWVLPLIHPEAKENMTELLLQMLMDLPGLNGRDVFVTVRSYQPWVEHALENLSAQPGPEQVLLVRHLTIRQRVKAEFSFSPVENGKTEPTIPVTSIKNHQG